MNKKLPKSPSIGAEILAGLTTFLAMAYILFVNTSILSSVGINANAVFIATCLSAGLGCLLVGWLSDYPISVAPGMALNVYFAFIIVDKLGHSWQFALAASFIAALLFVIVVVSGLSRHIVKAIPKCLHFGILVGLGCLLTLLALKNMGIFHINAGHMYWSLVSGKIFLLAAIGLFLILILDYFKIPGALIVGMAATSVLGYFFANAPFYGVLSLPPTPQLLFSQMDFAGLLNFQGVIIIISLFFVLYFDCAGTFIGLLRQANLPVEQTPLNRGLFSVSLISLLGSMFGTSGVSAYAESASGIRAGGRTGTVALTVGVLFICALFFSPLARSIPDYATAPALCYVGILMIKSIRLFDWQHPEYFIPSLITAAIIPYTFSIANGVGLGVISFTAMALVRKQRSSINVPLMVLTGLFVIYFVSKF